MLFGGTGQFGPLQDLWEFNGTDWISVSAEGGPSARYAMGAAYDALTQRTVMFGGRTSDAIPGGTWFNETWTWDGTSWAQLPGIDDPELPLNYHIVPDPVTGRLIMLAYFSGSVRCYAFDSAGWTRLDIPVPSYRQWFGYVADTVRERILVFGGLSNSSSWEFVAAPRPTFLMQPQAQSMRLGGTLQLSAKLGGAPGPQLRWYRHGTAISNGGRIAGATTRVLTILNTEPSDSGLYYLRATGTECVTASATARVDVWCFADLDGSRATASPDGSVDINDLLFFLAAFEQGSSSADLDNGSGTGVHDGGVDINDLLFFLARFEAGC